MSCTGPANPRDEVSQGEKKSCCAPSAEQRVIETDQISDIRSEHDATSHMVRLEGGTFLMGTDNPDAFVDDGEGPIREIELSPFWIDKTTVTNEMFARYIAETGHKTDAETFGWSFVFWAHVPKAKFRELVVDTVAVAPWWCKVPDANWREPEGPGSDIHERAAHPVVHVSWHDAARYCEWSGQRLPTEAEWEYAARGGLVQKVYPWGDRLRVDGKHMCNIWQGEFPNHDTGEDGFKRTCPVEAFPPNGYGLYSMTGNTWEWCADWFSPTFHVTGPRVNPHGPATGTIRVIKSGSFLCHKSYCNRYRVAARSSNSPDSSTSHMSFRCARDA